MSLYLSKTQFFWYLNSDLSVFFIIFAYRCFFHHSIIFSKSYYQLFIIFRDCCLFLSFSCWFRNSCNFMKPNWMILVFCLHLYSFKKNYVWGLELYCFHIFYNSFSCFECLLSFTLDFWSLQLSACSSLVCSNAF